MKEKRKTIWILNREEDRDQRLVDFMLKYPDFISGLDAVSLLDVEVIINLMIPICTQQVAVTIFMDFVHAGFKDYYKRKQSTFLRILLKHHPHSYKRNCRPPIWNEEFLRYMITKRKIKMDDMLSKYLIRILLQQYNSKNDTQRVMVRRLTDTCKILISLGAVIRKEGIQPPWFSSRTFFDIESLCKYLTSRHICGGLFPFLKELNDLHTLTHRYRFIVKRIRGFEIKNNPSFVEDRWILLPPPLFLKILSYIK